MAKVIVDLCITIWAPVSFLKFATNSLMTSSFQAA